MERLFVTNRPNYCHRRFAEVIGCDFYHVKHFLREDVPLISLPLNGYLNALKLPSASVYFSESIMDYYPVYYKNYGKKIILIAEDTLFKMNSMSSIKKNYILKLFSSADGFVAISDLCRDMLMKYVKKPAVVAYPFPHKEFFHVSANRRSKNVLFIGRDDKTKGFLQLVEAIRMLRIHDKDWNLYLVGDCGKSVKEEHGIHPLGFVKNMDPYMKKCSFLVHPAEFDPCPATIFEAMNAGIITVISNNMGQTKIFRDGGLGKLVLNDNRPGTIATKLEEISSKRGNLSSHLKKLSMSYREEKRLNIFKKEFENLLDLI